MSAATGLVHEGRRKLLEQTVRERLDQLRRTSNGAWANSSAGWPQIEPDAGNLHEPFPLTDIQQAYWLGRNSAFEIGGVGIHGYFELDCPNLDIDRLAQAWNRVIRRHAMMRAVIDPNGTQRILPQVDEQRFPVTDLRCVETVNAEQVLRSLRDRLSHQVFDPTVWPLFEIHAVRLTDSLTRLLFSEDAIHMDLVSSAMVFEDWVALYRNPDVRLQELKLSYRDYVLASKQLTRCEPYQRAADYWRKKAASLPPAPELPRVRVAEPVRFERWEFRLQKATWSRAKEAAAADSVSTSALLLAVYAEVLGLWSASLRFTLNVTVFNRLPLHPHVDQVAGDFTSMVLLEVDRTQPENVRQRAMQLQRQLWSDLEHRSFNGVEILRELSSKGGGAGRALMPYVFTSSLNNTGYRALEKLGKVTYTVTQTPQVLIDQQVFEENGDLVLSWDCVEKAFPPNMARAMFDRTCATISGLCVDYEGTRIEQELPPLQIDAPDTRLLHEAFSERAERHPHRIAIECGRTSLTYLAADELSNRIARRLRRLGAKPGECVAIVARRGWFPVVAALAVLKAGAAYLPIDPSWPAGRVSTILKDAKVNIALAGAAVMIEPEVTVLTAEDCVGESCAGLASLQGPDDIAYVLYTSGSTGVPKGVVIEHRSVVARMRDMAERLSLTQDDAVLAVTALHHDLSVFDIFGMLAFGGGRLVALESDLEDNPSGWLSEIEERRVTIWNSVPAYMRMLLDCSTGSSASLRRILLSGDRIPVKLPAEIRSRFPESQVYSLGGPTETTVWDIWHPVTPEDEGCERIPYGRPLPGAAYHVMKPNLERCPVWTPGELCIEGVGLARGYLNDENRTAEKFVVHPASGRRLYRSGDRGRLMPCGEIDILGRIDRQVKIHGQRIELAEIEAALSNDPDVESCAVIVTETGESPALAATVVFKAPLLTEGFTAMLAKRRSARGFSDSPVTERQLRQLLACLDVQETMPSERRYYPSAGSKFCVRALIHAMNGARAGVAGGWYEYRDRSLIRLSDECIDAAAHHVRNQRLFEQCCFSVFLFGDPAAVGAEYQEWARDFLLLEAGAMMQLLMMSAGAIGVALCPVGGIDKSVIPEGVGAGGEILTSLVGGSPLAGSRLSNEGKPVDAVLRRLRATLPRHMIPHRIVGVDQIPLNANGKVDYAKVAALCQSTSGGESRREGRSESSGLAELVTSAWGTILGDAFELGPNDHIFDAGVDSFQTVRAWAEIKERTGREFELTEMFANPTISALVAALSLNGKPEQTEADERAALRREALRGFRRKG